MAPNLVKVIKKLPLLLSLGSTSLTFIYMGFVLLLEFFPLSREYFKIENCLQLHDNRIAISVPGGHFNFAVIISKFYDEFPKLDCISSFQDNFLSLN